MAVVVMVLGSAVSVVVLVSPFLKVDLQKPGEHLPQQWSLVPLVQLAWLLYIGMHVCKWAGRDRERGCMFSLVPICSSFYNAISCTLTAEYYYCSVCFDRTPLVNQ